jgi:hypothetical protein
MDRESRRAAIVRAVLTILVVTIIVGVAIGGATYVVSRALVSLMS